MGGRGHSCGAAGALVKLLILSGARRNEITAPPRDQIKAEVIELPSERTKNGLPHTIPITPPRARLVTYGPNLLGTFRQAGVRGRTVVRGLEKPFPGHPRYNPQPVTAIT